MDRLLVALLIIVASTVASSNVTPHPIFSQFLDNINPSAFASVLKSVGIKNPNTAKVKTEEVEVVPDRNQTRALPYCSSLLLAQESLSYISSKLTCINPSPSQRSLMAMIMTVSTLSAVVGSGLDFDTAYAAVPTLLTLSENYPEVTSDVALKIYDEINNKLSPFQQLYDQEIGHLDGDIDASDLAACDRKLDTLVRTNPSLQGPGSLVLHMGKMGKMFSSRTKELEKVARTQSHKTVFSLGKPFIEPIIMQTAEAVKIYRSL